MDGRGYGGLIMATYDFSYLAKNTPSRGGRGLPRSSEEAREAKRRRKVAKGADKYARIFQDETGKAIGEELSDAEKAEMGFEEQPGGLVEDPSKYNTKYTEYLRKHGETRMLDEFEKERLAVELSTLKNQAEELKLHADVASMSVDLFKAGHHRKAIELANQYEQEGERTVDMQFDPKTKRIMAIDEQGNKEFLDQDALLEARVSADIRYQTQASLYKARMKRIDDKHVSDKERAETEKLQLGNLESVITQAFPAAVREAGDVTKFRAATQELPEGQAYWRELERNMDQANGDATKAFRMTDRNYILAEDYDPLGFGDYPKQFVDLRKKKFKVGKETRSLTQQEFRTLANKKGKTVSEMLEEFGMLKE